MTNFITKINRKVSKITLSDGRRFKAHPENARDGYCTGCAFNDTTEGCPSDSEGNDRHCNEVNQPSGVAIIWKKRKDKLHDDHQEDQR